jgi:feruloyl esterase
MYHGWSDGSSGGSISALNTISYYESVLKSMGPKQDAWFRLFMVPGMDHCGEGTGPNQFNKIATLERWREQNEPSITAARVSESGVIDRTRPLCPYPRRAVYQGCGSTNDAANFTCKVKVNQNTCFLTVPNRAKLCFKRSRNLQSLARCIVLNDEEFP